jgi:predicted unusual protein kinase regulating ubiquinone biosynthesis (AarF/ABC1/UbiB family)
VAPLAGLTARTAGGHVIAALREKTGDSGAVERFHERAAERYADLLGHSKGVLMKAGQLLSMIDTGCIGGGGLSPYQNAMARLQADAPPMETELAKQVVSGDLGRNVDGLFDEFDDEPFAAASIGQVHRAVLPDGRQAAVKIQYPGVAEAIRADLANTELLATFLRFAVSVAGTGIQPSLRNATREIAARISEEVDYRREAASINAFHDLYRGHPFIRVPEVIAEASGERVLTMTYMEGLDWADAVAAEQALKDTWSEVIVRFVLGSYRHANLVHVDPHCGNFRFAPDGTVGFLDFGCVKVLPEPQRRRFVEIARAVIDGRPTELRNLMFESGYFSSDQWVTADDLFEWSSQILHETLQPQPARYTRDTSRRAIQSILDAGSPNHVARHMTIPEDYVFFARLTLNVASLCAALGATHYARSIYDDMDGVAEPVTALGVSHRDWVRRRRLPFGLDHHDDA